MPGGIGELFSGLGHVLCVCPQCCDMFYLSEARPYLSGKQPRSILDDLRLEESKLDRAEERLNEIEEELREAAAKAGVP